MVNEHRLPASASRAELGALLARHGGAHAPEDIRAALAAHDLDRVEALLAASARRMLANNLRVSPRSGRPFLVPAQRTYGAQSWLWDLVFGAHVAHRLSLPGRPSSSVDEESRAAFRTLSRGCLQRTFEGQRMEGPERGLIPHMLFEGGADEALWGHPTASFLTQPPVFAVGVRDLLDRGGQQALFDEVKAGLQWWLNHRLDDHGLPSIRHPWESGEDAARYHDSQQLDAAVVGLALARGVDPRPLANALSFDLDTTLAHGDLLTLQTTNPSTKDPLTKSARFVLLAALRVVGGEARAVSSTGRPLFDVRTPSMAAHLALDLRAGADLADRLGHPDGARWRAAADTMVGALIDHQLGDRDWPRALGRPPHRGLLERALGLLNKVLQPSERTWLRALPQEVSDHGVIDVRVGTAAVALGALPAGHPAADRMLNTIASSAFSPRFGLPTLARDDRAFGADDYWRGSTWMNIDWLTCAGLLHQARGLQAVDRRCAERFAAMARQLARASLASAAEGYFEHYHANGVPIGAPVDDDAKGQGCGPVDFTWSGLALLMVDQLREAEALLKR